MYLWVVQSREYKGMNRLNDLRWFAGLFFTLFAAALIIVHCPFWALFPATTGVYILGSKLWDELNR
jgi:hypothetical protein